MSPMSKSVRPVVSMSHGNSASLWHELGFERREVCSDQNLHGPGDIKICASVSARPVLLDFVFHRNEGKLNISP